MGIASRNWPLDASTSEHGALYREWNGCVSILWFGFPCGVLFLVFGGPLRGVSPANKKSNVPPFRAGIRRFIPPTSGRVLSRHFTCEGGSFAEVFLGFFFSLQEAKHRLSFPRLIQRTDESTTLGVRSPVCGCGQYGGYVP